MSLITIILFLVYTWGLGFSITKFVKNSDNVLERNLMRIGIGLGFFPVIIVLLNFFKIPLDWKFFLLISMIVPVYSLIIKLKNNEKLFEKVKLTKSNIFILVVLIMFLITLFMYHKGAFSYEHLENDDPWQHALGTKYVSIEKVAETPGFATDFFAYLDPYPPGYDGLMGILHQTSPSLSWTLKFFNALIISLGIIFFYFFAKLFMGNRKKALLATFFLAAIPCYASHFIWVHGLIPTLFIVSMYCLEKIKADKKWVYPAILVIAGICFTHMLQPIKLGILFLLYLIGKSIIEKRFAKWEFVSIFSGYLLSFLWWGLKWNKMWGVRLGVRLGDEGVQAVQEGGVNLITKILTSIPKIFLTESGSATRAYTFNDFFVAKSQNMINNPIGIGIMISILGIIGIVFLVLRFKSQLKGKVYYPVVTLFWFAFLFLFVNSVTFSLPIGFAAFRMWMLLAIPVALLAAEGSWFLLALGRKIKAWKMLVIIVIIVAVIFTSGLQKYTVNTVPWYAGKSLTSQEEINGFVWLKHNTPINSKVFTYNNPKVVIGFDKYACVWCKEFLEFSEGAISKDTNEVHTWLKSNGFEYYVIRGYDFKILNSEYGEEQAQQILNERISSASALTNKFQIVHQNQGIVIFRVI